MVTSQQIIERSLYVSLLRVALSIGRTINPEDYLPVNVENQKRQAEAIKKLGKNYIADYGKTNANREGHRPWRRQDNNHRDRQTGQAGRRLGDD